MKKPKLSKGAGLAKIKWDEKKHERDIGGRFKHKPGSEEFKAEPFGAGKTSGVVSTDVIKLHVKANPKKAGSAAATDFAHYKDNMTVGEFKAAVGPNANSHLVHDTKKGFITIHDPKTLPPVEKELAFSDYVITSKVSGVQPGDKIKLLATANPKKPGSKAAADFAKYKDEMTVAEFHMAVGDKGTGQGHILHDLKKGYISVHNPADLTALKTGTKSPGLVAAEMKIGDKKLGVETANPFTVGTKNHQDFEDAANKLGLKTPAAAAAAQPAAVYKDTDTLVGPGGKEYTVSYLKSIGYSEQSIKGLGFTLKGAAAAAPMAAAPTGKPPKLADLNDDDIVISASGGEYTVGKLKTMNVQNVDAKLAAGTWTVKPKAAAAAPAKQAFDDDDVIESWLGNKYTVKQYKDKFFKNKGMTPEAMDAKIQDGMAGGSIKFVQKAPTTAAAKFNDDDIITSGLTGKEMKVHEYVTQQQNYYGMSKSDALNKLEKSITAGSYTLTKKAAPAAAAPAATTTTAAKGPVTVASLKDEDIIVTAGGYEYKVGDLKKKQSAGSIEFIDSQLAAGKWKVKGGAAAPTVAAPTTAFKTPKFADISTTSTQYDVMLTTQVNPYKQGSNEWIKFQALHMQPSKSMTVGKYYTTKALTMNEKTATMQQMIDDGHVKLVTPEQKAVVQAQKDKLAKEAAEQATKEAAEKAIATKNQYKAHFEQVKLTPKEQWYDDPKWGKVQGNMDPSSIKMGDMNKTKDAVGLKYKPNSIPAVAWYTDGGYSAANKIMRDPKRGYDFLDADQKAKVARLDVLATEDTVKNDVVMWRGVNSVEEKPTNMNNIPPPSEWVDGGYASMSFNPSVSMNFAGKSTTHGISPGGYGGTRKTLHRVRVPKGTKATFVGRSKTETGGMQDEAEVITARGTRFKYISHTRDVIVNGQKVDIIDVEIVMHDGTNVITV